MWGVSQYCVCTYIHTVWPESLAGRYFDGLLKICHLAEFTLAVEPVSHNDIHSKMANRTFKGHTEDEESYSETCLIRPLTCETCLIRPLTCETCLVRPLTCETCLVRPLTCETCPIRPLTSEGAIIALHNAYLIVVRTITIYYIALTISHSPFHSPSLPHTTSSFPLFCKSLHPFAFGDSASDHSKMKGFVCQLQEVETHSTEYVKSATYIPIAHTHTPHTHIHTQHTQHTPHTPHTFKHNTHNTHHTHTHHTHTTHTHSHTTHKYHTHTHHTHTTHTTHTPHTHYTHTHSNTHIHTHKPPHTPHKHHTTYTHTPHTHTTHTHTYTHTHTHARTHACTHMHRVRYVICWLIYHLRTRSAQGR